MKRETVKRVRKAEMDWEVAHKLADGILDLLTQLIELTSSALLRPFVQPFQTKILGMLREAGWTGGI